MSSRPSGIFVHAQHGLDAMVAAALRWELQGKAVPLDKVVATELALLGGRGRPLLIGPRAQILTSERLSEVYGRPIVVKNVDGHPLVMVQHEHS